MDRHNIKFKNVIQVHNDKYQINHKGRNKKGIIPGSRQSMHGYIDLLHAFNLTGEPLSALGSKLRESPSEFLHPQYPTYCGGKLTIFFF